MRRGDSEWTTRNLIRDQGDDLYQFRGTALKYTMRISVTQTNRFGTSKATTINFNVKKESKCSPLAGPWTPVPV